MDPQENHNSQHLLMQTSQTASSDPDENSHAPPSGSEDSLMVEKGNFVVRYGECMKNHAVALGGHVLDGCGEFMPVGEDDSEEALKCVVCGCHRNFHRKDTEGEVTFQAQAQPAPQSHYYPVPPPTGYLHVSPISQSRVVTIEDVGGPARDEQHGMVGPSTNDEVKKRFRTKFTSEQKEKMLNFAERVGWKIQKENKASVDEFCMEIGVSRQVLKVWLHNNKNTLGKKP